MQNRHDLEMCKLFEKKNALQGTRHAEFSGINALNRERLNEFWGNRLSTRRWKWSKLRNKCTSGP